MTSKPKNKDHNGDPDGRSLQTLRVRFTAPCNDVVEFVRSKGIGDAVLEAVRLEDDRAPDGCLKGSIVVDLAVVQSEMDRVIPYFVPVELPLSDVSMISLAPDSKVVERQTILRHYSIHARYMKQYVQRATEGRLTPLVASWYDDRFINMILDERKALMQHD